MDYGKVILKAHAGDPIAIKTVEALVQAYVVGTTFSNYLISDPQHAIEHVNERLDMGNRTEYERLPVTL